MDFKAFHPRCMDSRSDIQLYDLFVVSLMSLSAIAYYKTDFQYWAKRNPRKIAIAIRL